MDFHFFFPNSSFSFHIILSWITSFPNLSEYSKNFIKRTMNMINLVTVDKKKCFFSWVRKLFHWQKRNCLSNFLFRCKITIFLQCLMQCNVNVLSILVPIPILTLNSLSWEKNNKFLFSIPIYRSIREEWKAERRREEEKEKERKNNGNSHFKNQ